ncbi:hypothetical protein [Phormidesmis priestleyi]|nr:hypothetical protein [Phormidesmis priestleyi]
MRSSSFSGNTIIQRSPTLRWGGQPFICVVNLSDSIAKVEF